MRAKGINHDAGFPHAGVGSRESLDSDAVRAGWGSSAMTCIARGADHRRRPRAAGARLRSRDGSRRTAGSCHRDPGRIAEPRDQTSGEK
jgi:hypothetical protein